jgi:hypothetical protein
MGMEGSWENIKRTAKKVVKGAAVVAVTSLPLAASAQTQQEQPTFQDSLDLYNNARLVEDFYAKSGKYEMGKTYTDSPPWLKNYDKNNDVAVNAFKSKDKIKTAEGEVKVPLNAYRQDIDKNKYKQRESAHQVLNMDAPMQLFDRRMTPQKATVYNHVKDGSNLSDDHVELFEYDPIAVKPYKLLTPQEKEIRDKKYPPIITNNVNPVVNHRRAKEHLKVPHTTEKNPGEGSVFRISGDVPDSLRDKTFKTREEAERFIKTLPATRVSEEDAQ